MRARAQKPRANCRVQIGVFNELALQRFDLILSEAARNGIYVIFPLVDGDAYLGGPEWYYEQASPAFELRLPLYLMSSGTSSAMLSKKFTSTLKQYPPCCKRLSMGWLTCACTIWCTLAR